MTNITPNDQSNIIIYNTIDGKAAVALYAKDGRIWLNQKQMAELFATSVPNVNMHISNILKDGELDSNSVIKDYLITANDGKRYNVTFYSLEMILSIGYRVRSKRGVQFRQWATRHLAEYLVKGFTMDDERLKNPNGQPDYFDELLERIRDIRASEKRFYKNYALCLPLAATTKSAKGHADVLCRNAEQVTLRRYASDRSRTYHRPRRCKQTQHGADIVERCNC